MSSQLQPSDLVGDDLVAETAPDSLIDREPAACRHRGGWAVGAVRALLFQRTGLEMWSPSLWSLGIVLLLTVLAALASDIWWEGWPGHFNYRALPVILLPLLGLLWCGYLLDSNEGRAWTRRLPLIALSLNLLSQPLWVAGMAALRQDWWPAGMVGTLWRDRYWWALLIAFQLWFALALARQLVLLRGVPALRAVCLGVTLAALWATYDFEFRDSLWDADPPQTVAQQEPPPLPETALFFRQPDLLGEQLADLAPQRHGVTDLYLISVAGHGGQRVFLQEASAVRSLFDRQYGTAGRSVLLANSPDSADRLPMASRDTVAAAIQAVAKRMDRNEDVLVLFITSHGSPSHEVDLSYPALELKPITPEWLKATLERAGIRWKLVAVSACYAGGFVGPLRNDESAVLTAADATHTSFGCSDDAEYTYFGRAMFVEALAHEPVLTRAFASAKRTIAQREDAQGFIHSNPQLALGDAFARKLPALPQAGR